MKKNKELIDKIVPIVIKIFQLGGLMFLMCAINMLVEALIQNPGVKIGDELLTMEQWKVFIFDVFLLVVMTSFLQALPNYGKPNTQYILRGVVSFLFYEITCLYVDGINLADIFALMIGTTAYYHYKSKEISKWEAYCSEQEEVKQILHKVEKDPQIEERDHMVAIHETGHLVVALHYGMRVKKATILEEESANRIESFGHIQTATNLWQANNNSEYLKKIIAIDLAGFIAELVYGNNEETKLYTGCDSDLKRVEQYINILCKYSNQKEDIKNIYYSSYGMYSDEHKKIFDEIFEQTKQILEQYKNLVMLLVEDLKEKRTLNTPFIEKRFKDYQERKEQHGHHVYVEENV